MEFKVGDTVQLKSGGPPMTISEITGQDHEAECIWFDRLSIKRHRFNFAMLVEFRAKLTLEELVCGSYDENVQERCRA